MPCVSLQQGSCVHYRISCEHTCRILCTDSVKLLCPMLLRILLVWDIQMIEEDGGNMVERTRLVVWEGSAEPPGLGVNR